MIYDYVCPNCKYEEEVIKSYLYVDDVELCGACEVPMVRLVSFQGQMRVPSFREGYHPAFGKYISSPHQIRDEIRRERYENGREILEVGTERPKSHRKRVRPDVSNATRALRALRGK